MGGTNEGTGAEPDPTEIVDGEDILDGSTPDADLQVDKTQ